MYSKCQKCGKKLTDPESIKRGYGPECWNSLTAHYYRNPVDWENYRVPGQMNIEDFLDMGGGDNGDKNLTTAMWASMRDLLDNKQIVIEDDEQTIGQLSSRKYTMTSNGKLEIESKKEMKKRGLDSPDRADALALALYLGKIKKHTGTAPGVKELQELTKDNYWG